MRSRGQTLMSIEASFEFVVGNGLVDVFSSTICTFQRRGVSAQHRTLFGCVLRTRLPFNDAFLISSLPCSTSTTYIVFLPAISAMVFRMCWSMGWHGMFSSTCSGSCSCRFMSSTNDSIYALSVCVTCLSCVDYLWFLTDLSDVRVGFARVGCWCVTC